MSCDLVNNWFAVRFRAAKRPDFGLMTHCMPRDRRMRWRFIDGGYALHRGSAYAVTADDIVVGTAIRGQTQVTESFNDRGLAFQIQRTFGVEALGPLGVPADGSIVQSQMDVDAATEIFPKPPPPISFAVRPEAGGTIIVTVNVNNTQIETPAAEVSIYTDGGTGGGINFGAPLGDREVVGPGYSQLEIDRDPGLAHGTTLSVTVLTRSANDVESDQAADASTPKDVVIDSQGPPALAGFTVEPVCS